MGVIWGRYQESWRTAFAWLPVKLEDGKMLWMGRYQWRHRKVFAPVDRPIERRGIWMKGCGG